MSTIVYESDNLTILGDIGKYITANTTQSKSDGFYYTLRLDFVIHVNGKLRNFNITLRLGKQKDYGYGGEEYTLHNWNEWNNIFEPLKAMGYFQDVSNSFIGRYIENQIFQD